MWSKGLLGEPRYPNGATIPRWRVVPFRREATGTTGNSQDRVAVHASPYAAKAKNELKSGPRSFISPHPSPFEPRRPMIALDVLVRGVVAKANETRHGGQSFTKQGVS